jgi:hypothetical protein
MQHRYMEMQQLMQKIKWVVLPQQMHKLDRVERLRLLQNRMVAVGLV